MSNLRRQNGIVNLQYSFCCAIFAVAIFSGNAVLNAADDATPAAASGVLPQGVPVELTGAIATLPDNWKDWGTALSSELSALYEKPDADMASQRQAIAALRKRTVAARKYLADPRYLPILNVLVALSSGLDRRLDVAEAALDTIEPMSELRPARTSAVRNRAGRETPDPQLRQSVKDLLAALEDYESARTTASSAAVRKSFEAVRKQAPDDADRIGTALRHNYFNYNLRVVATEAYLNKLADQSRNEAGPVRDFILGADVYGNQTTHTDISLKLIPSSATAQFDVVGNGAVASSTSGYTDQATIETLGNHFFTARKRVTFDGERFSLQPANIGVNANNTTTGAETNVNLPILRGIARGIAMGRAEELRPEAEAIAASRVRDKVLPEFNRRVDSQFLGYNSQVAARLEALHELNMYPDAKSWSTTGTELKVAARLMGPQALGGSDPSAAMSLERGATVLVHDSLMDNYADTLDLAGKSMTADEITSKVEQQLSKLLGREIKFANDKSAGADESTIRTIVFDTSDPLRLRADDGALVLTIRAGFKQEGKEDIPTQVVTVPLNFTVDMKNIVIEHGDISIEAAAESGGAAQQLARAGVIRKKLDATFPRREIDRVHRIQRDNVNVVTAVTRIRALDGWLSITYE